jgi:hypothetical protein
MTEDAGPGIKSKKQVQSLLKRQQSSPVDGRGLGIS